MENFQHLRSRPMSGNSNGGGNTARPQGQQQQQRTAVRPPTGDVQMRGGEEAFPPLRSTTGVGAVQPRPPQQQQRQQQQQQQPRQQQQQSAPRAQQSIVNGQPRQPHQQARPQQHQQQQERTSSSHNNGGQQQQQQHQNGARPAAKPRVNSDLTGTNSSGGAAKKQPRKRFKKSNGNGGSAATSTAVSAVAMEEEEGGLSEPEEDIAERAAAIAVDFEAAPRASDSTHLSATSFASLPSLCDPMKRALKEHLKFDKMTIVQEASLPTIMTGNDLLAKAKTGTGKTIAFLLHCLNQLFLNPLSVKERLGKVRVLILSPTRELACQIEEEAKDLLHFQTTNQIGVLCVYGGYNVNKDLNRLRSSTVPVDVLIATPGRLQDLLSTPECTLRSRLSAGLQVFIMDEADRLLDMGFRPQIEKIIQILPKARQTLLFTATVPPGLSSVLGLAMRPGHVYIDTVGKGASSKDSADGSEDTHSRVPQEYVSCPLQSQLAVLEHLLTTAMKKPNYKVMIFLPTARAAGYYAAMFEDFLGANRVLSIHSRKSQAQRTRASDTFRDGTNLLLFSSDVSARGLDYPNVTQVIQVGLVDREQYVHRIGRTARAGKDGCGILLLADFEEKCMIQDTLKGVPIKPSTVSIEQSPSPALVRALTKASIEGSPLNTAAQQNYQAFLGFYNTHIRKLKWRPVELVQVANEYSQLMGLKELPVLERKTVGKMGLKGVPGLRTM